MELPNPEMDVFDDAARLRAVVALRDEFHLEPMERIDSEPSPFTIGIEIEMTWRQAFPDLAEQWPTPPDKNILSPSYRKFSSAYDQRDKLLRPQLQTITKVIPHVGFDAYWEFSFLPTKNVSVTAQELRFLYDAGILLDGQNYSLHMTVAGIDNYRDAFAFLCCIEMAGGTTPARILEAIESKKGAWSRKGGGGIMKRTPNELHGEDEMGYEFRSLTAISQEQLNVTLATAADLSHLIRHDPDTWKVLRADIEQTLIAHGLPLEQWPRPKDDSSYWYKYATLLEALQESTAA